MRFGTQTGRDTRRRYLVLCYWSLVWSSGGWQLYAAVYAHAYTVVGSSRRRVPSLAFSQQDDTRTTSLSHLHYVHYRLAAAQSTRTCRPAIAAVARRYPERAVIKSQKNGARNPRTGLNHALIAAAMILIVH